MDGLLDNKQEYIDQAVKPGMEYAPTLLLALLVLVPGWWLSSRLVKLLDRALRRGNAEPTPVKFLHSIVGIILKMVVLVVFATTVGVETASLIAVMGAVGLVLQGSLANFAGGVPVLFFKPFKVGDEIESQGYRGVVQEIQIFNTLLLTRDNERIVIPNGNLSNGCLKNIFVEPTRRVDMTYGISYDDDIGKAKQIIADVLVADNNVLSEPKPGIFVSAHADSSINILVRPWCKSELYRDVFFGTMENVKLAFDREGVTIPYPQRDLHIKSGSV